MWAGHWMVLSSSSRASLLTRMLKGTTLLGTVLPAIAPFFSCIRGGVLVPAVVLLQRAEVASGGFSFGLSTPPDRSRGLEHSQVRA